MDQGLSTRARALLQALRERSDGRQRLDISLVTHVFEAVFSHLRGRHEARAELLELLGELREQSLVRLPASKRGWDRHQQPPLPRWIQWPARPVRPRAAALASEIAWHPALAFITRLEGLRHSELGDAKQIQAWLARGDGRPEELAVRERSLEIFGDDKHLDDLLSTRLFAPGHLSLAVLRCHVVYVPLLALDVGGGDALLIVENKDTFDSAVRAVKALGTRSPVRWVAFGNGEQIVYSISSVHTWPTIPRHIWYFGDVDLRGVELLLGAMRRSADLEIPFTAHDDLYGTLLEAAHARGIALAGDLRCTPQRAHELAAWFREDLRGRIGDALLRGARYPQELVVATDLERVIGQSVVPARAPTS
jgi:hypothetical protein